MGPLGRRLFAAFALVALASVALLAAAALVGTDRGISAARQADRQRAADRAAAAAAAAYRQADGWQGADLGPAVEAAAGAGALLTVRDADGRVVLMTRGNDRNGGSATPGRGPGTGAATAAPGRIATAAPATPASASTRDATAPDVTASDAGSARAERADVVVDGATVGSVQLRFPAESASAGRDIAWGWVAAAALAALALALAVSWWVTRRLTGPLRRVAHTARALAAGDRTARSRAEAPGELGELSRAFDAMADDVTRAEEARRRLAADVAHELRTPLAALQAGLEELRDGYADPGPERLAVLHDQTLRLGRTVGDLAELAEAESVRLSLRRTDADLTEIVRGALAEREPELRAAGLTVGDAVGGDPLHVYVDADRLHQALGNLLSNAARYCRPGDTVTVTTRAEDGAAVVEVADTGPGIPAEELPRVFERLWRGSGARRTAGSGIGLAVVRELVAAHGGTVTAHSGPEGGARFVVRLPPTRPVSGT
ncbi:HAMP domain-containing protein [Streptomyces sp. GC420]|nr:HAMP domain-containing protein [Streptomyces sp. GC420]